MKYRHSSFLRALFLAIGLAVPCFMSLVFSAPAEQPSRLDAFLELFSRRYETRWRAYAARDLPRVDPSSQALNDYAAVDWSGVEPVLPLAVVVTDGGEQMADAGYPVIARIGDLVTTRVPASRLRELAQLESVTFAQASGKRYPDWHDVSVAETRADRARRAFGLSGRNVVVGIIDSGIDWRHEDFKNPDGTTRIKFLWDQLDSRGPQPSDLPGAGGTVYTEQQINASLSGSGPVAEKDEDGHGTHVAATAAGNGRATGSGFPAGTFTGMAPEADLVIVKTSYDDTDIINGLKFIDNRARELGKPFVVNMSFGSQLGAHDGTSPVELAVDNLVGPGKPGKVVIKSAGNDGASDIHAQGTLQTGVEETVTLQVAAQRSSSFVDVWYSGNAQFDVRVTTPTGLTTDPVQPGGQFTGSAPDGTIVDIVSTNALALNNSRNISISITASVSGRAILSGAWSIRLTRRSGSDGRFDAWTTRSGRFTDHLSQAGRISVPGTARNIITVASYITKNRWSDVDGSLRSYLGWGPSFEADISARSPFSSPGPSRDGRRKPEIAAPGQGIASALSAAADMPREYIVPDGKHVIMQGTSMAAPHVTGAVALILQADPSLDAAKVLDALTRTARADDYTGRVPNDQFGFGRMDVEEAVRSIKGGQGSAPVTPDPIITGIEPSTIIRGSTAQMAVFGSNFAGNLEVSVTPASGVQVNLASVVSDTTIHLNITASATAAAGTYQLFVTVGGRRSNPGIFRVEVANAPSPDPQDAYEPNDDLDRARPIPGDGRIVARISPRSDIDVYKFAATEGRKVVLDIDAATLIPASGLDSMVGVFDDFGNLLAFNDDDEVSLDSHLEWTPRVTGTYYAVVVSYVEDEQGPTSSGAYILKITGHAGDLRADTSPPLIEAQDVEVPEFLSTTGELFCSWSAEDPESGIDRYEYAIGSSPGASNIVPFTRTSNSFAYVSGLQLSNGAIYYFSIRAVNGAGLQSPVAISKGTQIDTSRKLYPLYFPRVVAFPGSFTGLAVANPSPFPVQVIYRLYQNSGGLALMRGIRNPTSMTLNPGEQMPLLSTEIFDLPSGGSPGWVMVETTSTLARAFYLYGADDLSYLDGADVGGETSTDLIFHRVRETGDYIFCAISLVNPNTTRATLTLELRNADGTLLATRTRTLDPKERLVNTLSDFFPGTTIPDGGTVRVRSNGGVVGFELFATESWDIGGLNPQKAGDTSRELLFAQLASLGDWFTEISLTNPNDQPIDVELTAFSDRADILPALSNPALVRIPARGQVNKFAADLFRFQGNQLVVGYVSARVVGGSGGIFGHVAFGTTNGLALAALPVQTRGNNRMVFSQVAQGSGFFTGLTLLNPSTTSSATVRVEVFRKDGASLGANTETFRPREKKARTIDQIVPAANEQLSGYILVTSDLPLLAFELFGGTDLSFLAAVPPQSLDAASGGAQAVRAVSRRESGAAEVTNRLRRGDSLSMSMYHKSREMVRSQPK